MHEKINKNLVAQEYLAGGISLSDLGKRYGTVKQTIWCWVRKYQKENGLNPSFKRTVIKEKELLIQSESDEELKLKNLEIKLLREIINVADKELGINIIKKFGAKQ